MNHFFVPFIHPSLPIYPEWNRKGIVRKTFVITESMRQVIEGADAADLNKLWGFSLHFWNRRKNTMMLSWRYNYIEGLFALTSYWHVSGRRLIGPQKTPAGQIMDAARVRANSLERSTEAVYSPKFFTKEIIMAYVRPDIPFDVDFVIQSEHGRMGMIFPDQTQFEKVFTNLDFEEFPEIKSFQWVVHPWYGGQKTPRRFGLIESFTR